MYEFIRRFLRKKHRGFSLIEIMAVVVIMGIVSAGVVNIVGSNAEKAKHTQAEKDLDSILAAMGTAYTEAGSFGTVTTNKDLDKAFDSTGTYKTKLEGQLSRELADILDPWGNGYGIVSTYNDTTKAGKITLVCTKTAATYDTTTNCRVNTYNNNKKMYRVVYSQ